MAGSNDKEHAKRVEEDCNEDPEAKDAEAKDAEAKDAEAKDAEAKKAKRKARWDATDITKESPAKAEQVPKKELTPAQQTALFTALLQQQATVTRAARRLYMGNLPMGITLEMLKELIETTMTAAKLTAAEGSCVNDIHLAPTGKYAFVEFRSAIECTNALALDNLQVQSQVLRVNRSHEYEPLDPETEKLMIPAGLPQQTDPLTTLAASGLDFGTLVSAGIDVSALAPKAPSTPLNAARPGLLAAQLKLPGTSGVTGPGSALTKPDALKITKPARTLYVGNLPDGSMSKEVLTHFFNAALVSARLHDTSMSEEPISNIELMGKFAFVECRTVAEATSFLALNGIELQSNKIRIGRPREYMPVTDKILPSLRALGVIGNTSVSPDGKDVLLEATEVAIQTEALMLGMNKTSGKGLPPLELASVTSSLALQNMVQMSDSECEEDMADILADVRIACEEHGRVSLVLSPRPGAGSEDPSVAEAIKLRVFVTFETAEAASACAQELHGKHWEGSAVCVSFISEALVSLVRQLPCFIDPPEAPPPQDA